MLLVYTACPLIRNVIAACHEQGGLILGTLSGKVIFGQEVVGGRKKVVGLDWVELDERGLAEGPPYNDEDSNLGDKNVRRPSKERDRGQVVKIRYNPLWSEIPLTGDPGYLDKSSSETLKVSLHQMIPSKYILKYGLSHFYFDNSPTDSFVKCKAVAALFGLGKHSKLSGWSCRTAVITDRQGWT